MYQRDWALFLIGLTVLCAVRLGAAEERFDYHSIHRPAGSSPNGRYEGETHFVRQGNARVQGMRHYGPQWSRNAHFLWDGAVGDEAKLEFRVVRTSRYRLSLRWTRASDYGLFQVSLDGKSIGDRVDLYAPRVELATSEFGQVDLDEGPHSLTFKLVGANKRAVRFQGKTYMLGLDYAQAIDVEPPKETTALGAEQREAPDQPINLTAANVLLKKYCVRCHRGDKPKGGVQLATLLSRRALLDDIDRTEQVAEALSFGAMPPEDEKQPTSAERRQLAAFFEGVVDQYANSIDTIAPTVMRRLNRYEYNNVVRDLLHLRGDIYPLPERVLRAYQDYYHPETGVFPNAVQVGNRTLGKNQVEKQVLDDVSPFAIDLQAEHGFNNRGDQLSVSPLLLETFVKLGNSIVNSPQFANYSRRYAELFVGSSPANRTEDLRIARGRLSSLLSRAFRQPIDEATLKRYVAYFVQQYDDNHSFSESMKSVVGAVLASPRFLYLVERKQKQAEDASRLSDHELATRLSFFLWSTIPDEELRKAATQKRLTRPDVLDEQVRRMLLDKRSQALSENFARQWLRLDQLTTAVPDFNRFPEYYSRIGCEQWKFGLQMMVEPLLLFESIVVEDRSIMLLVDSNYSYRSGELQSWYEDKKPFGGRGNINRFNTSQQDFVRRELKTRRQGGVITTAAAMTMTSSPLRTRPITRGAWVATVILNRPPEPPPDVVPEIEADDNAIEAKGITLRQRLKQHQLNDTCAACHAKIDPLGFVLENFDVVGRWRDSYRSGLPIDTSGKLFGDAEFTDIEGFKDVLLDRPKIFMRAFTEHLLSYALGRELRADDKPTVDRIVRRVNADHGRFSTVVLEVVRSRPFRHKAN